MTRLRDSLRPCCWTCLSLGLWAAFLLVGTFALLTIGASQ